MVNVIDKNDNKGNNEAMKRRAFRMSDNMYNNLKNRLKNEHEMTISEFLRRMTNKYLKGKFDDEL